MKRKIPWLDLIVLILFWLMTMYLAFDNQLGYAILTATFVISQTLFLSLDKIVYEIRKEKNNEQLGK